MAAPFCTRFAPSPTGLLHLGNIRTALFSWLAARRAAGRFVLRLEDTDAMRGHEQFAVALQRDLRWLGLDWDEGPGVGGPHGPYAQSERGEVYGRYFARLEESGLAYPCFCTEHELEIARKTAIAAGRPPRYSGRCRSLTPEEIAERRARGLPATLRFRITDGEVVAFDDQVRGRQEFATADIGDFIIRRSDGTPAFFFCNAVDDALMEVTLVLRGEDHLANTPRQMLLLRALALPVPAYGHIALVFGADGQPLSKRTGSRSLEELRRAGFLPTAINNYLARLGHTYEDNSLLTLEALAAQFSVERLHRAPARFDELQLVHWQKEAVRTTSTDELWRWMSGRDYMDTGADGGGRIEGFVPNGAEHDFVEAIRDNVIMPLDAFVWAGNLYAQGDRHGRESKELIRTTGRDFFGIARQVLEREKGGDFRSFCKSLSTATGAKGKALYMPLRAALTGETHGPELDRLWRLLGYERVHARLEQAISICTP